MLLRNLQARRRGKPFDDVGNQTLEELAELDFEEPMDDYVDSSFVAANESTVNESATKRFFPCRGASLCLMFQFRQHADEFWTHGISPFTEPWDSRQR